MSNNNALIIGGVLLGAYLLTKGSAAQAKGNAAVFAGDVRPKVAQTAPMKTVMGAGLSLLSMFKGTAAQPGTWGVQSDTNQIPGSFGNPLGFGSDVAPFPWLSGSAPVLSEDVGGVGFGGVNPEFRWDQPMSLDDYAGASLSLA